MQKEEIMLSIINLIKNPKLINVQDEKGNDINDFDKHDKRVFNRGIQVGLSIAVDIIKNS